jgi:hypothetical protein
VGFLVERGIHNEVANAICIPFYNTTDTCCLIWHARIREESDVVCVFGGGLSLIGVGKIIAADINSDFVALAKVTR